MRDFKDWNMQMRDQQQKEERSDPAPANAKAAQLHDSTRTKRQPAAQGSTPFDREERVRPRSRRARRGRVESSRVVDRWRKPQIPHP